MSNPAPTLNQINAFNATQGTTIDFNIIGGTEVIRSNKIYIYDLSDNSLICTHLYVSTEPIHELPPNTSTSIVYASGKSSSDFTNNTQYYAQIQTYTDTNGTQGASGLSVAKLFWCLPTPTLTLSTIPTTISTTSYNVSATYTPNTSGGATNEVQEFQFNLYSAIGALLQTSGVVLYGEGVDLSYNFSGLEVDSTYYVTLDVTTTQGMNVSAQSNTFTVSIDTPTMGSASVVNNGCDGYISVTSNLSSEYKHEESVDSGEIMSFTTESLNDIVKLVVDINPLQDLHGYSSPWVGGAGKNKLGISGSSVTSNGITFTLQSDGSIKATGTLSGSSASAYFTASIPTGSYIFSDSVNGSASTYWTQIVDDSNWSGVSTSGSDVNFSIATNNVRVYVATKQSPPTGGIVFKPMMRLSGTDNTWQPWENICPITGWTGCDVNVSGKNLISASFGEYVPLYLPKDTVLIASAKSTGTPQINYYDANQNRIDYWSCQYDAVDGRSASRGFTLLDDAYYFRFTGTSSTEYQLEFGNTATAYEPYNGQTYPVSWQTEAGAVYGGTVDVVSGVLTITHGYTTYNGTESWSKGGTNQGFYTTLNALVKRGGIGNYYNNSIMCDSLETYPYHTADSYTSASYGITGYYDTNNSYPTQNWLYAKAEGISTAADFKTWLSNHNITVCYELATPIEISLTPQQMQTLSGQNNIWSNTNGGMYLVYQLPITSLLVKRRDVADVSGKWLTLYSTPITQASDMDFTFIDFLNQYGKTYQYALVPVLAQDQSGVVVQIEGGYTVSDNVDSIFDGVYIADQTNVERVKAGAGYGNIDMNQGVGSITPIGSKYPIVITNSQNQYHNGSVRGTIVPNDFYSNGNLSRIDMVNKRDELEQFLTNKRAKIIKDWNGKMWLVMIMSNVACSFDDNYGMGMVSFSADWLEVGDPTNQQDLYNAGLINVGGV